MTLRERLARQPPGYNFTIGRILAIYSGLMVTLLLAALDQTIVATALPRIVSDLGGITQYSWVFTAYMLTSTVTVPLYGKLGDVYGRKNLFLFAIVVFLLGSALCGAATDMTQLVVFRAIQGIGAGGLFPLSLAVIGNIVPPRDRGRWQGLIGAVFAAASILGPAVGGFIVDNASWRWVFLVNLPVGGLALAQELGMAMAAIDASSARIGDAEDMMRRGIVSRVNALAAACGVAPGQTCAEAAERLKTAPWPHRAPPARAEGNAEIMGTDAAEAARNSRRFMVVLSLPLRHLVNF